jgi:hypothetical protein
MAGNGTEKKAAGKKIGGLAERQEAGKLVSQMLNAFIRGKDPGDRRERAALLVEKLWNLATSAPNDSTRLAAIREIMDRVDGKVVERREVRSLHIQGILYLPAAADIDAVPVAEGGGCYGVETEPETGNGAQAPQG